MNHTHILWPADYRADVQVIILQNLTVINPNFSESDDMQRDATPTHILPVKVWRLNFNICIFSSNLTPFLHSKSRVVLASSPKLHIVPNVYFAFIVH